MVATASCCHMASLLTGRTRELASVTCTIGGRHSGKGYQICPAVDVRTCLPAQRLQRSKKIFGVKYIGLIGGKPPCQLGHIIIMCLQANLMQNHQELCVHEHRQSALRLIQWTIRTVQGKLQARLTDGIDIHNNISVAISSTAVALP